jgi:hypothetical protein
LTPGRRFAAVTALSGVLIAAGCGFGAGSGSEGTATLTVTRDYGTTPMASAEESGPSGSETVLRFLDRNSDITTRYGGGFVQSIDGVAGAESAGRRSDWFFYVNGVESPVGSADVPIQGGDRIWWDYRDWTDAMTVPAVVGSFPQPFASAGGPTTVDCAGEMAPCRVVSAVLRSAGVDANIVGGLGSSGGEPRVLVGPWDAIEADETAAQIGDGPSASGVFARFDRGGTLEAFDVRGAPARTLTSNAGLVAAVRLEDDAPTWLVTGTDAAGVAAAAALFTERRLGDHYALAADGPIAIPLPAEQHVDVG